MVEIEGSGLPVRTSQDRNRPVVGESPGSFNSLGTSNRAEILKNNATIRQNPTSSEQDQGPKPADKPSPPEAKPGDDPATNQPPAGSTPVIPPSGSPAQISCVDGDPGVICDGSIPGPKGHPIEVHASGNIKFRVFPPQSRGHFEGVISTKIPPQSVAGRILNPLGAPEGRGATAYAECHAQIGPDPLRDRTIGGVTPDFEGKACKVGVQRTVNLGVQGPTVTGRGYTAKFFDGSGVTQNTEVVFRGGAPYGQQSITIPVVKITKQSPDGTSFKNPSGIESIGTIKTSVGLPTNGEGPSVVISAKATPEGWGVMIEGAWKGLSRLFKK